MTSFDMFCGVFAAGSSVTCISLSAWSFYFGLVKKKDDELHALFLLLGFVLLPMAYLFGYWANGESWIILGVISVVIAGIVYVRSLLALEDGK